MKLSAPWYAVLSIDGTIAYVDLNFCTTKIAQGLKQLNASICYSGKLKCFKNKWNFSVVDIQSVITFLQDHLFYILFDNIDIDEYGLKDATKINQTIAELPCPADRTYIFVYQESQTNNNNFNYRLKIYDMSYQCFELLEKINDKKFNSKEHQWYLNENGLTQFKHQISQNSHTNLVVNYSLRSSNENNTTDSDENKPLYGVISTTARARDLLIIGSLDLNFCTPQVLHEFKKFKSIQKKSSVGDCTENIWNFSLIDIDLIISILKDCGYFILFSNIDIEKYCISRDTIF